MEGSKYTVYNKERITITKVNLWTGKNVEEYTNITHGRKEYKLKRLINNQRIMMSLI